MNLEKLEKDLLKQFSVNGKGEQYDILASRQGYTFGKVRVSVQNKSTNVSLLHNNNED